MKDLEGLAEVVTDTSLKIARKELQPVQKRLSSMDRSLKSAEIISREAIAQADTLKAQLEDNVKLTTGEIQILKSAFEGITETYGSAIESLMDSQANLTDALKALPEPIDFSIQDLHSKIAQDIENREAQVKKLADTLSSVTDTFLENLAEIETRQTAIESQIVVATEKAKLDINKDIEAQSERIEEVHDRVISIKSVLDTALVDQATVIEEVRGDAETEIESFRTKSQEVLDSVKDGVTGEQGDPGPRGPKGEPGTMASSERWTKDKLYKAGASVIHRGGTWYSEVTTVDEPGEGPAWSCISNGVDVKEFFVEDGLATQVFADGQRVEYRVAPRNMGIYSSDERYIKGDVVQNDYGTYQAKCDSPSQIPGKQISEGEEAQWRTIAGRGKRGARGHPGDPKDAAAIVYAQLQKDLKEGANLLGEYLEGVAL